MSEALAIVVIIGNGLVTWGVVSTKLSWMRRDIDRCETRLDKLEARPCIPS